MKFNKDDTVYVNNHATSYRGEFNGTVGTVKVVHATELNGIRYGVDLIGFENKASRTGLFWFSEFELSDMTTFSEFVERLCAAPLPIVYPTISIAEANTKSRSSCCYLPKIKKVIFNPPATIIFWHDDTKTVVKAVNEPYDPEKGLAMAISKKAFGNNQSYYSIFERNIKNFNSNTLYADDGAQNIAESLRHLGEKLKNFNQ